ncbi:hypothetical protein [Flagellimonas sp. CMM7]|uniref:hypothetical protein n=1 Tax=Flagellimonas sp. CMM7 TaxID=2654676 RepID=UPI0013D63001|nr:hypothetical protein [Flagellimonas sp. CMM7]UII81075.1 hypothetical protein LV704_06055 [Flagellimonas sp. CMM7]
MIRVQLHFQKNLNPKTYSFFQDVDLEIVPSKGDIFNYEVSFFNELSDANKKKFEEKSFDIGNYYVTSVMNYTEKEGLVDYIVFIAQSIN